MPDLTPTAEARIAEAARWHRCWHCFSAPCRCPAGEGLGLVPWIVPPQSLVLAPVEPKRKQPKGRKFKSDPEQVRPGSYQRDRKGRR